MTPCNCKLGMAHHAEAAKWRNEAHRLNLEVERLRKENDAIRLQAGGMQMELDELRAQLAERDALLERALRLLTPNVGRFRGSVGWAVEVDRFLAALEKNHE